MPDKPNVLAARAQAYSMDGAIGGGHFWLWGWENIQCETPLQKLLLFLVGDGMCADGICCETAEALAKASCSTRAEVEAQLKAWLDAGVLGLAFSEHQDRVGYVFPAFYSAEVQRVYDQRKAEAAARAAKKAAKLATRS